MYYRAPNSLGLWWWFYDTPKNQHAHAYVYDDGRQQWSAARFLTDPQAESWYLDAIESLHSGATYQDVHWFVNRGQGWFRHR
jgi:hypothetical protein